MANAPQVGELLDGYRFLGGDPGDEASWQPMGDGPEPGDILDGFTFKGGDPSKESSWEKIGPKKGLVERAMEAVLPPAKPETETVPAADAVGVPEITDAQEAASAGSEYWTGGAEKKRPKTGSVTDDIPSAAPTGPPITPSTRAGLEYSYATATPEERERLKADPGYRGQSVRANAPAVEARVGMLESQALKQGAKREDAAAFAARNAVIPDEQARASDFDFETAAKYRDSTALERGFVKGVKGLSQSAGGAIMAAAEFAGLDPGEVRDVSMRLKREADAIGEKRETSTGLANTFENVVSSIVTQAPSMIQAIASGGAFVPLLYIGAQSAGQEYVNGRASGLSPDAALLRSSLYGAAEVIGERFALPAFATAFRKAAAGVAPDEMARLLVDLARKEIPGEMLTTTLQFGTDKAPGIGLNQEAGLKDLVSQLGDTIAQTVMQVGITSGGALGVNKIARMNPPSIGRQISAALDAATLPPSPEATDAAAVLALRDPSRAPVRAGPTMEEAAAAVMQATSVSDAIAAAGAALDAPVAATPQTGYGQLDLPVPPLVPERGYTGEATGAQSEAFLADEAARELQRPAEGGEPGLAEIAMQGAPTQAGGVISGAPALATQQAEAVEKRSRGELLSQREVELAREFDEKPAPKIAIAGRETLVSEASDSELANAANLTRSQATRQIIVEEQRRRQEAPAEPPRLALPDNRAASGQTLVTFPDGSAMPAAEARARQLQAPDTQAGARKVSVPASLSPERLAAMTPKGLEAALKQAKTPEAKAAIEAEQQRRKGNLARTQPAAPEGGMGADIAMATAPDTPKASAIDRESADYLNERAEAPAEERATSMDIARGERKVADKGYFEKGERQEVRDIAENAGRDADEIEAEVRRQKARHPLSDGWAPLRLAKIDPEQPKIAKAAQYKVVPWTFHLPPGMTKAPKVPHAPLVEKLSAGIVKEVRETIKAARAGDKSAQAIVDQMHWYRDFTKRLRRDFGGFGDTFADLIGATSARQNVTENYKQASEIAARFLRGEFDVELRRLEAHLAKGKSIMDFPSANKIRSINGALSGMNSAAAMRALLGIWREAKTGSAPKTRNFAANLAGTSIKATIDSWAARTLQRLAGKPRIPMKAEDGVGGAHLKDPSVVGGAFGFGQKVFEVAAKKLSDAGVEISPADLQAVMWFKEKALWTKNDWGSELGEEGSLEAEAGKRELDRYQGLMSVQQGEEQPDADNVARAVRTIEGVMKADPRVFMYRSIPTKGGYMDFGSEESIDLEAVVDREFDPMPLVSAMVREAKDNNQDSVGLSRVVRPDEDNANARPGIEVSLLKDTPEAEVLRISNALRNATIGGEGGIGAGGFTLAVDPRKRRVVGNRPAGEYIGIRVQFVPEIFIRAYHNGWAEGPVADRIYDDLTSGNEARVQGVMQEARKALHNTLEGLRSDPAVAYADAYNYDTLLIGKEDYDGYTATDAGVGDQEAEGGVWPGQPAGERLRGAARRHAEANGIDVRSLRGGGSAAEPRASRQLRRGSGQLEREGADGDVRQEVAPLASAAFPVPQVSAETPVFNSREQQPDAVTAVGVRFGHEKRTSLNGRSYGKGVPGQESLRIQAERDPELRQRLLNRVYFYAQTADELPRSESIITGNNVSRVKLTNLYDLSKDPRGLYARAKSETESGPEAANRVEQLIMEAGFDGYVNRNSIPSPALVLLDIPGDIPAEYLGYRYAANEKLKAQAPKRVVDDVKHKLYTDAITAAVEKAGGKGTTWPDGTKMNLVPVEQDVPAGALRTWVSEQGDGTIEGFYDPQSKEIWIITGNLSSVDRAIFVATAHEVFHAGLRKTIGAENIDPVLRQIHARNKRVREQAAVRMSRGMPLVEAVEEVLADMPDRSELKGWDKLLKAIKDFLAKIGIVRWTDEQVETLVAASRAAVREGGPQTVASTEEAIAASEKAPVFYSELSRQIAAAKATQGLPLFSKRTEESIPAGEEEADLDFTPRGLADIAGQMKAAKGAMKKKRVDEFASSRDMARPLQLLKAIATDKDAFQYGDSTSTDSQQIAKDMGLTSIAKIEDLRGLEGYIKITMKGERTKRVAILDPDGTEKVDDNGDVQYETKNVPMVAKMYVGMDKLDENQPAEKTTYLDTSDLRTGKGGKEVYQLAYTWAARNGYVQVPDPSSVSPMATEARIGNMISAAMRLGTTKFMWPVENTDVNPIYGWQLPEWQKRISDGWKYVTDPGNEADLHNQRLLAAAAIGIAEHKLAYGNGYEKDSSKKFRDPQTGRLVKLEDFEYNFDYDEIVWRDDGDPVAKPTLDALLERLLPVGTPPVRGGREGGRPGGKSGSEGAGATDVAQAGRALGPGPRATLARALVLRSANELSPQDVSRLSEEFAGAERPAAGTPREGILASRRSERIESGPAALQSAAAKVDTYAPDKTFKQKVDELKTNWAERFIQGVFDAYAPLQRLGRKEYLLARMVKSADASLEATLLYGKPRMGEDGVIHGTLDGKGFLGHMQELQGEHDDFFLWVAGKRAARLMKEGRENLFTPEEIEALVKHDEGKMKDGSSRKQAYAKAQEALNSYNKAVLDIAEKTGLIDGESRKMWEHEFYVPFFRVNDDMKIDGPAKVKGLVRQKAFEKLKGGKENLGDLLDNTLRNWSHLLSASLANQAALANLKAAAKAGIATEVPESAAKDMVKSAGVGGATFAMDGGTKHWYIVDDAQVLDAISAVESASFKGLPMELMGKFKHYLTLGVTASPTFRVRNLMRDSISAIAQSDLSYNVAGNVWKGFKATDRKSKEYAEALFNGALIRFGQLTDGKHAEHAKRLILSGVDDATILDTPQKAKAALGAMWDWWQETGDRAENVNRMSRYMQGLARGESALEAAFASRDMMDFSLQGSWAATRFLTQIVPFMNARLQGMYKLGRAAKEDPARMGYVVGATALLSIALLLAYKDDDEWKKREDWDRDNYWWFRIGDKAFRIPKPFEIGAMGTLAERSVEMAISDEMTGKRFGERLRSMLGDTLALNPTPQLFKPMIDVYANKDSFSGRMIESRGMENLTKPERVGPNTSLVAKTLGKAGETTQLSPAQIDFLIKSYFGWLGSHAAMTVDLMAQPFMDVEKPARKLDDVFVLGDFVKALPAGQSRYVEDFYKQAKVVHEVMGDLKRAREIHDMERVREIMEERKDDIALARLYTGAERKIGEVNKRIRIVQGSNLSGELKRQRLDELEAQRAKLAEQVERIRTARRAAKLSPALSE